MQLTVNLTAMHPTRAPRDVFDSYPVWLHSPDLAFSSWLQRQSLKSSSKTIYIAMFRKFATWMKAHNLGIEGVGPEHLRRFLDGENITKHHRYRYIRLVERAFDHLGTLGFRGTNPGRRAAQNKIGAGENDPSRFLTAAEIEALVRIVKTRTDESRKDQQGKNETWTEMRDAALVAAMLGGGLKVAQAQNVTVNCMDLPEGWIVLRAGGRDRPHRAKLQPFAREALAAWIAMRRELELPGDLLFPAQRRAIGFKPKKATMRMHATSIYRAALGLMLEAGITGSRSCAQTLRNAYAGQLFDDDAHDDLVTEYLGFFKAVSAQRLRAAHLDWQRDLGKPASSTTPS